jgi:hypothetical protein
MPKKQRMSQKVTERATGKNVKPCELREQPRQHQLQLEK